MSSHLSRLNLLKRSKNLGVLNKPIFFLVLFSVLLLSCQSDKKDLDNTTFISGMIVNPKMDYVILSQGNNVLDTIDIDSENFFFYKTDKIDKEELITLIHYETQVFYIAPGDSLVLHLNTMDFDESLNYSGRGAAKNNLLMTLFLANEKENKDLHHWYTLSPEVFTQKIDSLRAIKEKEFKNFLKREPVSEGFKEVASVAINYDYYSKKELYGTANRKRLDHLDDSFYAHRKNINFGNENLRFYYPYYRFLIRFFDNLMVAKHPFGTSRNSFEFNRDKLYAIDSLSTTDSIRNSLTRITALRYFTHAKKEDEQTEFLSEFKRFNNNPDHILEIEEIYEMSKKMSQGKTIPNVPLLSMDNATVKLHDVVNKPSVLYFWSDNAMEQGKIIHNRAAELKAKYPEFNFIGINTDDHFRKWRSLVTKQKFNSKTEFQFENPLEAEKTLVIPNLSKAIIVSQDKVIYDGNTNMFHGDFENILLGYLNQ